MFFCVLAEICCSQRQKTREQSQLRQSLRSVSHCIFPHSRIVAGSGLRPQRQDCAGEVHVESQHAGVLRHLFASHRRSAGGAKAGQNWTRQGATRLVQSPHPHREFAVAQRLT